MGAAKQKMLEEMESAEGLKDRNLDKNGEYLNCTECQCRLKPNERWSEVCLRCAIKSED